MRWILAGVLSLAVLAATAPVAAQSPEAGRNQIVTTGHGQVDVPPDQATLTVGAQLQRPTAAETMAEVNNVISATLTRWQQLGIRRENIRTSAVQVFPVFSAPREGSPQVTGYRAISLLTLTTTNLSLLGRAIDAAVAAGANTIHGISFGLRSATKARTDALAMAVREAREKADAIAQAAGVRIRGIDRIVEGGVDVIVREARAIQAAPAPTPVEPGLVTVTAQVTIVFNF
ncbi:MAG: SIMPL domain-containing protein [bacterium]